MTSVKKENQNQNTMTNIYLDVPYAKKDEVKNLGARWDPIKRKWYINEDNVNKEFLLERWGDEEESSEDLLENTENNPEYILDWIYESLDIYDNIENISNTGKWLLFYHKHDIPDRWNEIVKLYRDGQLDGVMSMKRSTLLPNDRSSCKNTGVIILYCNKSEDEERIMGIGRNIILKTRYDFQDHITYKADWQTRLGTVSTGNTNNSLYKLYTST